jgi:hypothetical protein
MSHFLILFFFLSPSFSFFGSSSPKHILSTQHFFPPLFRSHFLYLSLVMDSSSRIILSSLSPTHLPPPHMKSLVHSPIKSENHTPKSIPIKPNRHPSNHLKSTPQHPYPSNQINTHQTKSSPNERCLWSINVFVAN